jgi:aminopeptidase-like protein
MYRMPQDTIEFMDKIGRIPRHLISDGYSEAMGMLLERARMARLETVHYCFPTGYDCGTWIIPEKFTLRSAKLSSTDGNVLLDAEDNGLICMSYSLPFFGKVTRNELFEHLHTHENLPDAVPFAYNYYNSDWGLCCSENFKKSLTDDEYIVEIDTAFSKGHMEVGEIIVPGQLDETFILASHLCHPHQLNDGPIGAIIGIEVLKKLREQGVKHTFRLLVMPETIGSVAWISKNKVLIPLIRGGLFCEMLTVDLPFRLNYSYMNNSLVDRLFEEIVKKEDKDNICERFNYGNDERQFNGPGVLVPMLALHRSNMSRFQEGRYDAYPEYHSEKDNIDLVTKEKVQRAYDLILAMLSKFDSYLVKPMANFKGEPCLSRFKLHLDNLTSFGEFMDIVNMCDRGMTIYEIGKYMELDPGAVVKNLKPMEGAGLVRYEA